MTYHWRPTTADVYQTIFAAHHASLAVWSSHACGGSGRCAWHSLRRDTIEWAFDGEDVPIIRQEIHGEEYRYFILGGVTPA